MLRLFQCMKIQSRHENVIYLALWGMLFAAPVLTLYLRTVSDTDITFDWREIWMIWRLFAVFLGIFLVHNFFLAPLLVYQQRRILYASLVGAILTVFVAYQCTHRPQMMKRDFRPHKMERPMDGERPPFAEEGKLPREPRGEFRPRRHVPPAFIGQHDIVAVVILVLMFGMNLGVKFFFKNRIDQKKLVALEKENLEQQLEYLKYQINPHFFMNTLNNIHALVDIDPEKAKTTILELSRMMRFILYEGDKNGVPLTREFDFIRHYVTLMKLRYTDKVDIRVDLPAEAPDKTVPPLMLISFIENAFKHGISYQHTSFIDIRADVDNHQLHFVCRNSKADTPNQEKGGVGLANVKQRLNLLYDNNFTLNINDADGVYSVELTLPLT